MHMVPGGSLNGALTLRMAADTGARFWVALRTCSLTAFIAKCHCGKRSGCASLVVWIRPRQAGLCEHPRYVRCAMYKILGSVFTNLIIVLLSEAALASAKYAISRSRAKTRAVSKPTTQKAAAQA